MFLQSLYLLLLIYRLARIPSIRSSFTTGLLVAYAAAVATGSGGLVCKGHGAVFCAGVMAVQYVYIMATFAQVCLRVPTPPSGRRFLHDRSANDHAFQAASLPPSLSLLPPPPLSLPPSLPNRLVCKLRIHKALNILAAYLNALYCAKSCLAALVDHKL